VPCLKTGAVTNLPHGYRKQVLESCDACDWRCSLQHPMRLTLSGRLPLDCHESPPNAPPTPPQREAAHSRPAIVTAPTRAAPHRGWPIRHPNLSAHGKLCIDHTQHTHYAACLPTGLMTTNGTLLSCVVRSSRTAPGLLLVVGRRCHCRCRVRVLCARCAGWWGRTRCAGRRRPGYPGRSWVCGHCKQPGPQDSAAGQTRVLVEVQPSAAAVLYGIRP
jgi:hypothetical protein